MVHMKGKIMTWDEFRVRCKMDALCRYYSGYSSAELTAEDIINDYDESFFSDSPTDEHDELSSYFTPDEIAQKTLDYIKEMEV